MRAIPTTTDPSEGEYRKLDAHALLQAWREVYVLRGRRALLTAICYRGYASADDVRHAVPLPDGINPKLFGVVPGALVRAGIIEADGFVKSRRLQSHTRPISAWRLVDRAAALAWLATHPDRPDPPPAEVDAEPTLFDSAGNATPGAGTPGGQ